MAHRLNRLYEFGPYQVDPQKLQLWRNGTAIPLPPKAAEILLVMLARSGETVSKDELMRSVWPDSYVEESNLTQNIFLLRKALGQTAQDSSYIITLPGKGYRFVADVRQIDNGPPAPVAVAVDDLPARPEEPAVAGSAGPAAGKLRRLWLPAAGLVLIALVSGVLWLRHGSQPQAPPGRVMLAVLPFENLTGDSAEEYFSDGMTEEMIAQLGNLDPDHLGVIARTSVMHYKNSKEPLDQIGRELGVQYALEGSVRRDADKVRITAQLIEVKGQSHLWARRYDRELSSTLALQGEIAQEIASEIQRSLRKTVFSTSAVEPSPRSTTSYEAYDLYLKGRYFWNKRTTESFQQAIGYFQQAIAIDPGYAQAYAGLADCYVLMPAFSGLPPAEFMEKARGAAQQALRLDDGLAEAHTSLALITENYDWNWPAAGKEYRRAIELNPNYATAHHWYAEYLTWLGRFDEALRESERARELDPLSLIISADDAMILYYSRQYDRAEARFRAVLEMDPAFARAHLIREVYVEKGRFDDALADLERDKPPVDMPWYFVELTYLQGRAGHSAEAQQALEKVLWLNQRQSLEPSGIARAYEGLRDADHTLEWLNKACARRSNAMTSLKVEPGLDFLRADPRFQNLIHRVGLDNPPTDK
jgi:TolB-like protein/DNA-binding winged helix-turn-helix (wHTH) protein